MKPLAIVLLLFLSLSLFWMTACTHREDRWLSDAVKADSAIKQKKIEQRNPEEEARSAFLASKFVFYGFRESGMSVLPGVPKECAASVFARKDTTIEVLGFIEPPEMFTTTEYFEARLSFARRYNATLANLLYPKKPNQALLPTSMSVTDCACAHSAPDTLAADL